VICNGWPTTSSISSHDPRAECRSRPGDGDHQSHMVDELGVPGEDLAAQALSP
jgi:hypothetical protein